MHVGGAIATVRRVGEDEAIALLFGFVGSLCAALAWRKNWRSRQGRPWFGGDRTFGSDHSQFDGEGAVHPRQLGHIPGAAPLTLCRSSSRSPVR